MVFRCSCLSYKCWTISTSYSGVTGWLDPVNSKPVRLVLSNSQPLRSFLLFRLKKENNDKCAVLGHSMVAPATLGVGKGKGLLLVVQGPFFCVSEPTKPEAPGFISSSIPIPISGCRP